MYLLCEGLVLENGNKAPNNTVSIIPGLTFQKIIEDFPNFNIIYLMILCKSHLSFLV